MEQPFKGDFLTISFDGLTALCAGSSLIILAYMFKLFTMIFEFVHSLNLAYQNAKTKEF